MVKFRRFLIINNKMIKVTISGASGRMGKALIKAINKNDSFVLLAGATREENNQVGKDLGEIAEIGQVGALLYSNFDKFSGADVIIDFSEPIFSLRTIEFSKNNNIPIVLGTTGYKEEDLSFIEQAAKIIPILKAPNTSIGIAFLRKIIDLTPDSFSFFDKIEISEKHHKDKKDSPSGTAIDLANFLSERVKYKDSISIESQRSGDVAGEHKVILSRQSERVELSHKALDRSIYAEGALVAAQWLKTKRKGLYSMTDIYT